eukprot:1005294-Karenia_brevis.AAC.1
MTMTMTMMMMMMMMMMMIFHSLRKCLNTVTSTAQAQALLRLCSSACIPEWCPKDSKTTSAIS